MIGYAIKKDRSSLRAILSIDEISHDEYYSDVAVEITCPETTEFVENQRLIAYANPITGSDRYFAEASRLTAMRAPAEDIEAAIAAGIARAAEIAAMYPWPEDSDTA